MAPARAQVRPVLGDHLPRGQAAKGGAAVVGWDSNPAPPCFAGRGRSGGRRVTCDSRSPGVTARARPGPAVPGAVRTQRGPANSSLSALFAQPVPRDWRQRLADQRTAGDRWVLVDCHRTWPKHGPGTSRSRGQRRSAWRTLAGKVDPRRLPPTSESRLGDRLVRGSPGGVWARDIPLYRRAVPDHRHGGPQHSARSNRAHDDDRP
jgi:hypothetical protein